MSDLGLLKELFQPELFGNFGEQHGRRFAQLRENDPSAVLRAIDIYDVPDDALLIEVDKSDPPHSLFSENKGQCRRCDYLLIAKVGDTPVLVFIEMKSADKVPEGDVKQQFYGALSIVEYCNATLRHFHGQRDFFGPFKRYFVAFYKPRLAKRGTRPRPPGRPIVHNSTPEQMLKYASPHNPSLRHLIGL